MRFGLGREDYEVLFLGLDGKADDGERRRLLDGRYPLTTAGAVQELRTRGLDASPSVLDYLIERKSIPAPTMEGGRRRWTAADIDRAAEVLDAEGAYVPAAVMRQVLNLDPGQDERARRQALAGHREVVSADCLVLEVLQGAPGAGVRATARIRSGQELCSRGRWEHWYRGDRKMHLAAAEKLLRQASAAVDSRSGQLQKTP